MFSRSGTTKDDGGDADDHDPVSDHRHVHRNELLDGKRNDNGYAHRTVYHHVRHNDDRIALGCGNAQPGQICICYFRVVCSRLSVAKMMTIIG